MSKGQSLNDIFARLSSQGIEVASMRNKVNRLEELFIRLVDAGEKADAAPGGAAAGGAPAGGMPAGGP